jgi:hypothetical protein
MTPWSRVLVIEEVRTGGQGEVSACGHIGGGTTTTIIIIIIIIIIGSGG